MFRKRSGSQCSYINGADEISVSKIAPDVVIREVRSNTIQSIRSSCSEIEASDYAIHESCVVRNFPKHKSSHLRFLAWVAYTRKYTDEITDTERRTCPLLWCRVQFPDQEAMLEHVYNCPELSKGLYWCFHCQKPERVGKFQCKRCQGFPSRTDRMASVAKKIFSKLGSKAHRHEPSDGSSDGSKICPNIREPGELSKSFSYLQEQKPSVANTNWGWNHEYIQELASTSICSEMADDFAAASHELPDTYISEMTGTEIPIEMGVGAETWADNLYSDSLADWDMPPPPVPKRQGTSPRPATLRVDTSFSSLTTAMYQGCLPQQKSSASYPQTPLSPAIISPLSAGHVFSATSLEISPTDSNTSGTWSNQDSGYSSATTTISAWNMPAMCEKFTGFEDKRGGKRSREEEPVFEDWIHDSAFSGQTIVATSAELTLVKVPDEPSELVHSHGDCAVAEKPRLFSAHWCDAPTLVHSFSEALDAHIEHTKSALKALPSTSIIKELLAMSKTSMVSIGLEVLAGILEGRKPTAVVQVFAFTHIACAFVIATEQDEGKITSQAWFEDIVSWVDELASVKQRQHYKQIARSIWRARDVPGKGKQPELYSRRTKENSLYTGCKHFLDILEAFGSLGDEPVGAKDNHLESVHRSFSTRVQFNDLISTSPFSEDLVNIERRLHAREITSTRELELELICAGKIAAQSTASYQQFLSQVTQLCDSLYAEESKSRTTYYMADISLVKHLLPEEQEIYNDVGDEVPDQNSLLTGSERDQELFLNFGSDAGMHGNESSLATFFREADEILNEDYQLHASLQSQPQLYSQPLSRNTSSSSSSSSTFPHHSSHHSSHIISPHTSISPTHNVTTNALHQPGTPSNPATSLPSHQQALPPSITPKLSEVNVDSKYRCACGFVPSGDEKWKSSNLRRHKRTQHGEAKTYRCRYPGCVKIFNRSDNLKSHQSKQGHGAIVFSEGVGDDETSEGKSGREQGVRRDENERPGKRRKFEV